MKHLLLFTIFPMFFTQSAPPQTEKECPNLERFGEICMLVSEKLEDDESEYNLYLYQTRIYDAACVDIANDSPEEVKRKVQVWWNKYRLHLRLKCDTLAFRRASLIKYAIQQLSSEFIEDVTNTWGLDMNFIEPEDGKTVLDYLSDQINKEREDSPVKPILKRYYEKFKKTGAKHSWEL